MYELWVQMLDGSGVDQSFYDEDQRAELETRIRDALEHGGFILLSAQSFPQGNAKHEQQPPIPVGIPAL